MRVSVRQPAGSPKRRIAGRYAVGGDHPGFTPLYPFDPGGSYEVALRCTPCPAVELARATLAGRPSDPHALDRRRARLSERRHRPGQPAADVHRVLRADGPASRARTRHAARRPGPAGRRSVPACRRRAVERRPHPLHGVLRSGPSEARHPAQPRDGRVARRRTGIHAAHQPRLARRQRPAAP